MLVMFALTVTASLAGGHLVKGLIAGAAGLLIRTVGEDDAVGVGRFDDRCSNLFLHHRRV